MIFFLFYWLFLYKLSLRPLQKIRENFEISSKLQIKNDKKNPIKINQ
jgi:hypothetical protein